MYLHQQLLDNLFLLHRTLPKLNSYYTFSIIKNNYFLINEYYMFHIKYANTISKLRYQIAYCNSEDLGYMYLYEQSKWSYIKGPVCNEDTMDISCFEDNIYFVKVCLIQDVTPTQETLIDAVLSSNIEILKICKKFITKEILYQAAYLEENEIIELCISCDILPDKETIFRDDPDLLNLLQKYL